MSTPLREALRTEARTLTQRVLDRMYENPFWMERYGERGRRFADDDGLHHVRYLEQALASRDAAVFERYAQWLRSVLVSRGMCSEHLAANFRLLAEEIVTRQFPDAADGVAIRHRGDEALRYTEGPAAPLDAQRDRLLHAAHEAIVAGGVVMRDDDRRHLLSSLLDSIAAGSAEPFVSFSARCDARVVEAVTTTAAALGGPLPPASSDSSAHPAPDSSRQ
jgi:hypothetical protein